MNKNLEFLCEFKCKTEGDEEIKASLLKTFGDYFSEEHTFPNFDVLAQQIVSFLDNESHDQVLEAGLDRLYGEAKKDFRTKSEESIFSQISASFSNVKAACRELFEHPFSRQNEIADDMGKSPSNLSNALKKASSFGLVESKQTGRSKTFFLTRYGFRFVDYCLKNEATEASGPMLAYSSGIKALIADADNLAYFSSNEGKVALSELKVIIGADLKQTVGSLDAEEIGFGYNAKSDAVSFKAPYKPENLPLPEYPKISLTLKS